MPLGVKEVILDFIRDQLDGNAWEHYCDEVYRDRYKDQNYIKIPASHGGDGGIEGFTHTGIVYQSYCPEKNYSDQELYEHVRDKVTRDINKLIDTGYSKKLKSLGVHKIKEWHFVTPEYKDSRLVEHLEKKRKEVLAAMHADQETFSYIDPNIILVPKVAEDFKAEFARLIRNPLVDLKLNAAVMNTGEIDWTDCPADKINNLKRKLIAIMKTDENDCDYKKMVSFWAEAYLTGIEIMRILQGSCGTIYENLFALEQQYRKEVSMQSSMRSDHSINNEVFTQVLENFGDAIRRNITCFSEETVMELKRDLVGGWLADCSLDFKAE